MCSRWSGRRPWIRRQNLATSWVSTWSCGLSAMLHNEGITTVVVAGVTLNVAIPNTVFDLVNAGFQVVVPTDGSVATPVDYGDQVLAHTLAYVATLSDVTTLTEAWLQA